MITAVITNHNYGRFIGRCIESAVEFCDEVYVYDDGSDDDSLDRIPARFLKARRTQPSGSSVWAFNHGIRDVDTEHILFLDADNFLVSRPPTQDEDYVYSDIRIVNEAGVQTDTWSYPGWPLSATQALHNFRETTGMPVPAGGVWRTDFLREKDCRWQHWQTSKKAEDFRTYIAWMEKDPTIGYRPEPHLAFRVHSAQASQSGEKQRAMQEAYLFARGYRL